jgi:Zn-dependent protease
LLDIDFSQVFIGFLVLLFSLTVHEAAHAWSADRLGDATARMLGRVSLNPAVHIDPIGTILFPLIALAINLPVIGWAKPVPVNILQLRGNWRSKFMAIAAAGPASNLVMAAIAAILLHAVAFGTADPGAALDVGTPLTGFLERMVVINVLLAVFNMLPVPPLDGGNVLSGLLRGPAADVFDRLRPYGFLILYALIFTDVLWTLVGPPANLILRILL